MTHIPTFHILTPSLIIRHSTFRSPWYLFKYMTTIYKFCSYCSFQISTHDISYDIDLHIVLIINILDFDPNDIDLHILLIFNILDFDLNDIDLHILFIFNISNFDPWYLLEWYRFTHLAQFKHSEFRPLIFSINYRTSINKFCIYSPFHISTPKYRSCQFNII